MVRGSFYLQGEFFSVCGGEISKKKKKKITHCTSNVPKSVLFVHTGGQMSYEDEFPFCLRKCLVQVAFCGLLESLTLVMLAYIL